MENKNEPAFPLTTDAEKDTEVRDGLSKREYFAGLAMQGLLANTIYHNPNEKQKMIKVDSLAQTAANYADALLKALEP